MSKNEPKEPRVTLPAIPAQTKVVSTATVTIGLGLACILAWLKMAFMSPNIFQGNGNAVHTLEATYFISLVATVAALWLLGVFHTPAAKLLGRGTSRIAVPLCVALSTAAMALGDLETGWGVFFVVASGVATGLATACLNVIFGVSLSLLPTKHTVAACVIGYVTSDVVSIAYLFFDPVPALMLCAIMAPIGMLLLSYGVKCFDFSKADESDPLPPQSAPSDPSERKDARTVQLTFAALLMVAGCVYELTRTIYTALANTDEGNALSYLAVRAVTTCVLTAFAVAIGIFLVKRTRNTGPINCYRIIFTLLALNAACLATPVVYPGLPANVPLALDIASFDCLGMLMWVLVTGICGQYPQSCFRIFAFMRAAWSTGPLLGAVLGRIVCTRCELDLPLLFGISLACLVALLVMGNFVFTEGVMNKALNILPSESRRRFVERCKAVIRDFGLSEREGEIMIMFAKGRNLPYVQQELCLSKGTVSTHRQHIYQKLGVHSAQEMIDLIQGYEV